MFVRLTKRKVNSGYSVKKLADLAGVSVRTLHLYDEMGLLNPSVRTGAGYRLYGEKELLRLQQIMFYKEMDFSLRDIAAILDDPDFDLINALEQHQRSLRSQKDRLDTLLTTVDNTIYKLKNSMKLSHEDLYKGFPSEKVEEIRNEAVSKYGRNEVERAERSLKEMRKEDFAALQQESEALIQKLFALRNEDATSSQVQELISGHYTVIRKFWGTSGSEDKQAEAYKGLGQLYVNDDRFKLVDGNDQKSFAHFMSKAMDYFSRSL